MPLINGTKIAFALEEKIRLDIEHMDGRKPGLAFIRIGNDPGAAVYIGIKKKKCKEVGILSFDAELSDDVSEKDVLRLIWELNKNPHVDGILLQLPIPPHLNPLVLMEQIDPNKDVDGFHPINMGKLLLGDSSGFVPCTPQGIHTLLVETKIPLAGRHVVIVGRSNIVGKPLAALLMQKKTLCNATVTVAHARTEHLASLCREADILIAALGKPKFITDKMVKEGAVVIDVGINRLVSSTNNTLVGDVDFDLVSPLASYITPVPKGVGPMTIACLLSNTLKAYLTKGR